MKALLKNASLSVNEDGITDAEVYAYAAGLELISAALDGAEEAITNEAGYAALLGLDAEKYSDEGLGGLIKKRASYEYSMLTAEDFDREFSLTNASEITVTNGTVVIGGVDGGRLYELSVFLKGFSPLGRRVIADGGGMTFDLWEATGFSFSEYDALDLPFDILDTLRSDTFEQH